MYVTSFYLHTIESSPNLTADTKSVNPPKTPADVEKDTKYTTVRNGAKNMHDNAESYAYVYGILSSDMMSC